jgi:uncharacterized membrane protein (UPF0127 family)
VRIRNPAALGALLSILVVAFVSCGAERATVTDPPGPDTTVRTTPVRFGDVVVHAELATTSDERATGLMGRTSLPDTAGMLFVYPTPQSLGFWMKDTPIDLSIAFLDSSGRIINIAHMNANDDRTTHYSSSPAQYALEVRRGWFADRGITAGATATFTLPPGLRIDP